MKFNDWMNSVEQLQKRVGSLCVDEISESIFVEGKSIRVGIKDMVYCYIDGTFTNMRYLRSLYTHYKEEFTALLESLESRAGEYYEAMSSLTHSVTLPVLSEMTVKRLAGTIDSIDPQSLLNQQVKLLSEKLFMILEPVLLMDFKISFKLSEQTSVYISLQRGHVQYVFSKDSDQSQTQLTFYKDQESHFSVEECLHFMGSFDAIKAKTEFIAKSLIALKEGLGELRSLCSTNG